jgi:tetratricopeptide (TPR) repeat protein
MTGSESDALLATAEEALVAGRWAEARDGFRAALDVHESGAALFGLGLALWWLREPAESIRLQERAYRVFRRSGDHEHAFFTAMYLCLGYDMTFGNSSASRGWLAKLSRLAKDQGLTGLEGWVLFCRAVVDHDRNPAAAERWAQQALDVALVSGDADLDVCARSELGAAMIELGRLSDGAELLDEAMAGALGGEVETLDSVVLASCRTIISCSRAADVKRAAQWIRAASNFNERYGSPHLYTTCRVYYAALLILSGHWGQAEDELNEVLAVGALVEPLLHAEALSLLASLRLAQGRVEEAERLIAGFEQYGPVGAVLAAIRAAQGQFEVACWLVRRRLSGLRQNCLEAAQLLVLLIDFEIAAGELQKALADAQRLVAMTVSTDIPMMRGRSYHALGSALCAAGDVKATRELEHARAVFVVLVGPEPHRPRRMGPFAQEDNTWLLTMAGLWAARPSAYR